MKRAILMIGAGLVWSAVAQAEVNYDYAQLGYAVGDIETDSFVFPQQNVEESYSGYTAAFSASFVEYFLFQGEYKNLSIASAHGDIRNSRAGVGGRFPLDFGQQGNLDVYGTVNYEEFTTFFADGNGAGATLGVRWQPSDITEFGLFTGYADYGEVEDDQGTVQGDLSGWRVGVQATFDVSENFAISTEWRTAMLEVERNPNEVDLGDVEVEDSDVELNEELWFSLRYYWR